MRTILFGSAAVRIGHLALSLVFVAISSANASPLNPGQVEVLDGDTIRIAGVQIK